MCPPMQSWDPRHCRMRKTSHQRQLWRDGGLCKVLDEKICYTVCQDYVWWLGVPRDLKGFEIWPSSTRALDILRHRATAQLDTKARPPVCLWMAGMTLSHSSGAHMFILDMTVPEETEDGDKLLDQSERGVSHAVSQNKGLQRLSVVCSWRGLQISSVNSNLLSGGLSCMLLFYH